MGRQGAATALDLQQSVFLFRRFDTPLCNSSVTEPSAQRLADHTPQRCSDDEAHPAGTSTWQAAGPRVPRLHLGSLRGPSTLSQSSIGDSPLQRLLSSPTCSSLGTLTRSSTALSGFLSPPAASPAPFASASKATATAYSGLRHKQSTSNNLLADIKNLKRELEGSPSANSATRRSSYNGSVWGEASTSRSSMGGSSMHTLDASLQRLARLTEGLSRSRLS